MTALRNSTYILKMSKYNVWLTRLEKIINNKLIFVISPSRRSKILLANGDDNSAVSVFKPSKLFIAHIQNVYLIDSVLEVKVKQ